MTIGLLGGGHPGTFALRFQFEKSAPVVLRHDLDEGTERVVPVFEEGAGAGAAGEEMVTLHQDAQTLRIEAQGAPMPLSTTFGARWRGRSSSLSSPSSASTGSSATSFLLHSLSNWPFGSHTYAGW